MKIYQSKYNQLPGSSLHKAYRAAHRYHNLVKSHHPRRRPYVRSRYFKKDKVFVTVYWSHAAQKNRKEQLRRIRLYKCALDLIRNTMFDPLTIIDPAKEEMLLHRFYGRTQDGLEFCVQIKQNQRSGRKDFVSAFPVNHKK